MGGGIEREREKGRDRRKRDGMGWGGGSRQTGKRWRKVQIDRPERGTVLKVGKVEGVGGVGGGERRVGGRERRVGPDGKGNGVGRGGPDRPERGTVLKSERIEEVAGGERLSPVEERPSWGSLEWW